MKTAVDAAEARTKLSKKHAMQHKLTAEARAHRWFSNIMETAPLGLLICAALGLSIVGVFQFIFYFNVLPGWDFFLVCGIAGALAVFFEGLGFYFLVATVRDFSSGARREGFLGLFATALLWAYALWEAVHISSTFDTGGKWWSIFGIIGTITCIVRVVEVRIALTVTSATKQKNQLADAENELAEAQKKLLELTGKVVRFEEEKQAEQERKSAEEQRIAQERERLEELEAAKKEQEREQEMQYLRAELRKAQQRANRSENTAAAPQKKSTPEKIIEQGVLMMQSTGIQPSKKAIEKALKLSEGVVSYHFPNGQLAAEISRRLKEEFSAPVEVVVSEN